MVNNNLEDSIMHKCIGANPLKSEVSLFTSLLLSSRLNTSTDFHLHARNSGVCPKINL
jgi:hypothetical protein